MTPQQEIAARSSSPGHGPRLSSQPPFTARAAASAPSPDAVARLAALPSGVVALVLGSPDPRTLFQIKPFSRQTAGRAEPGRPHVVSQQILGGWTIDLGQVFARQETLWYALGFGTNALATMVWLGMLEREINESLGANATALQIDALVFPSRTPGVDQAHGRLLFARDGRVLFEGRDNRSVFEGLQARTLYLPDADEPAFHPPMDVVPEEQLPLQSGSALVPGAFSRDFGGSLLANLHVIRLAWKPYDFSRPSARTGGG